MIPLPRLTRASRLVATAACTALAATALALPAAPAHAGDYDGDPDPVRGLLLPPLDALVGLLAPLPVPATPYTGDVCVDGADACIDDVIVRMQDRLDGLLETCSHSAVFSLAYLRVTENVRDAVRSGYFQDRAWLNRLDAVFAEMYFDTTGKWATGQRTGLPKAWQIALQAEDDRAVSGLGNFLLAMNAHINSDFPHVLATVGLTGPDGSHKADHNRYNNRLDSLYVPVFTEEAARFDPTFDDIDAGTVDDTVVGVIMRGWREMVWRHAEALVLARTPAQRALVDKQIEVYSTLQAQLIRTFFAAKPAKRDAWCATHGAG
ncbi:MULTISPECIES: DUF5995 family protein [unclassified Nocardioides]|uniref:DUF5995 family protein n=1 Tax=unclassified Nocardioides TaxID=2615069 RepID=UPI0007032EBB|nr:MULTISPECIES: DUF5995 family protein [unclassified Nocardioides]KRC46503.1 hypothetical protein ASE19_22065 [Nocardioides sp. Root79]KRC69848.1 hypothetical protein ASE20_14920 [Nocardioides sp. Root240]